MKYFLFIYFISSFFTPLNSQDKNNFEFTIDSEAFGKERKISVFIPDRYLNNPNDSFAVTYILDAQSSSVWNMAKGNINYLVNQYQILPTIAVGIHTESRQKEFLPESRRANTHPSNKNGTALILQRHFESEIFPLIKEHFRVNNFRALIGHSRAGFFVAHTLFSEHLDLFNAYLMISPGLHYLDRQILQEADSILQSEQNLEKFFYCSVGTLGSTDHFFQPYVEQIDSMITANTNPSLIWVKNVMQGSNHATGVIPSINWGLVEMSRNYMLLDFHIEKFALNKMDAMKTQIESHYKQGVENLGYAVQTDVLSIKYYADELSEDGHDKRAFELYEYALELDPTNFSVYETLGWRFLEKGEKEKAVEYFRLALEHLDNQKEDRELEWFEKMKKRIERTIGEIVVKEK